MPQEHPQVVHVHAVLQAASGEVVAEAVGAAAGLHPRPPLQPGQHDFDGGVAHRLAVVGQPHGVRSRLRGDAVLGQVGFQVLFRLDVDGQGAPFVPLAQDAHLLQLGVQLGELHLGQLVEAQAGIDEDRDDGPVADAQVAVAVLDIVLAEVEQGVHLFVAVGLDVLVIGRGQPEAPQVSDLRAFREVALVGGPVEEGFGHLEVVVHGARRRLFVGAAAAVALPAVWLGFQVLHEVVEVLAGERRRLRPLPQGGEVEEAGEAYPVVLQRPRGEGAARPGGEALAGPQEAGDEFGEGEGLGRQCLAPGAGCSGNFRNSAG